MEPAKFYSEPVAETEEITRLIVEWQKGDSSAEAALFEALYRVLHRSALQILRTERSDHTLGATALVHEAYVRLRTAQKLDLTTRTHFLALAARVMRRILTDRARARMADKRAEGALRVELNEALVSTDENAEEILSVDQALETLSRHSPRQCQLVELRYFAGYTMEESAAILGVSDRTARREWQVARTRLRGIIDARTGSQ